MLNRRFFLRICILSILASTAGPGAHADRAALQARGLRRRGGGVAACRRREAHGDQLRVRAYRCRRQDRARHARGRAKSGESARAQVAQSATCATRFGRRLGRGRFLRCRRRCSGAGEIRAERRRTDLDDRASTASISIGNIRGLPGAGLVHRSEDDAISTLLLRELRQVSTRLHGPSIHGSRATASADRGARRQGNRSTSSSVAPSVTSNWINLMTSTPPTSLTPTTGHHSALARSSTSAAESAASKTCRRPVPSRQAFPRARRDSSWAFHSTGVRLPMCSH